MNLLSKVKQTFGNFSYRRRSSGIIREKKTVNFDDAKKVGLLYLVSDEKSYTQIVSFIKKLESYNKTVTALGFVKSKDVPAFFSSSNAYSFFTLKDLNWYEKPSGTFIDNFLNEKFDIVINISLTDVFPLQYISGLSKASLRVGKFEKENSKYYDLMIEIENIKDISAFVEQIVHYLSIIKNKHYA